MVLYNLIALVANYRPISPLRAGTYQPRQDLKEFLQLEIPFFSLFFFSFELTLLGYASTQSISYIRAFRHNKTEHLASCQPPH